MPESVVALYGNNPVIVNDATRTLIAELVGERDHAMALEEFVVGDDTLTDDEKESFLMRVMNALNTPPFLVDHRFIVLHNAYGLAKANQEPLTRWLAEPTPGVTLVLSGVATKAHALLKVVPDPRDVTVGRKEESNALREAFRLHDVHVEPAAVERVVEILGEEVERFDALARTLLSVYGNSKIGFSDLEPYLGDMGNVPEWNLTGAVDAGNLTSAMRTLKRMLESEGRVPVQIVGIMQRHYLKLAQLDNTGATTKAAVMKLLGVSEYPAQKLLGTYNALGSDRLAYALRLVTQADVDVKGATALDPLVTVEILIARLTKMSETARRR